MTRVHQQGATAAGGGKTTQRTDGGLLPSVMEQDDAEEVLVQINNLVLGQNIHATTREKITLASRKALSWSRGGRARSGWDRRFSPAPEPPAPSRAVVTARRACAEA